MPGAEAAREEVASMPGTREEEVARWRRRLSARKGPGLDSKTVLAALFHLEGTPARQACKEAGMLGDSHSKVRALMMRIRVMRAAAGTAAASETWAAGDEPGIGTADVDSVEMSPEFEGEKETDSILLQLPEDVWVHLLLQELGTKALGALATTCRALHEQGELRYALDRRAFVDELVEALIEVAFEELEAPRCSPSPGLTQPA